MSYALAPSVINLVRNKIATCTRMSICPSVPVDAASVEGLALASVQMQPVDFSLEDVDGVPSVVVASKLVRDIAAGTAAYVVLDDGNEIIFNATYVNPSSAIENIAVIGSFVIRCIGVEQ